MSLAGGIFDQPRIAGSEAPLGAVAETNFQFTGYQNYILPPRRGMPVNKRAAGRLRKYDMSCGLRLSKHWMLSQALFFQMRFAVGARVHSEDCHDHSFTIKQHPGVKVNVRVRVKMLVGSGGKKWGRRVQVRFGFPVLLEVM